MKQKVGPVVIVLAVVGLIGYCYFIYQHNNPSAQSAYDPTKVGPPGYARGAHANSTDRQNVHP